MLAVTLAITAVEMSSVYLSLITHFADPLYLARLSWQTVFAFPCVAVSCCMTQGFLAHRAWLLSNRSKAWAIYLAVALGLSVAACAIALAFAVWYSQQALTASVLERQSQLWAWWVLQALGETMVTASLLWFVAWKSSAHTHGKRSSELSLVRRVVLRGAETNALSVFAQVGLLVLFAWADSTGFWVSSFICTVMLRSSC